MPEVKEINRFKIIRKISSGGQGAVYLGHDTQLDRQVAIKMVHTTTVQQKENLLREARITSKFIHPNIVPLHDVGEHEGFPYLVYAFIEGDTLAQLLKRTGKMTLTQAARLMVGVLDGLEYAHQQGVMHLDVKPANVIVTPNTLPMLLDFGIALHVDRVGDSGNGLDGTPNYMAPERFSSKGADFRSDIYSVGTMLYEMVTGRSAVEGDTVFQILHRAANMEVTSPSIHNSQIDERFEVIIRKAIAKNPEERFANAASMRQALLKYLDSSQDDEETQNTSDSDSTLSFLLRRMRSKGDFPALSGIVSEINTIVASESSSHSKLAQAILQDFALTNKVLKLVNTASFGQFGGNINTISKAVVILGFDTVRNIAMTLILLEFLQNKSQAEGLKDEVIASFFAGILAAELSEGGRPGDAEEAMICGMFHNLGRLLATFYFFEESQEVNRLMQDQKLSEERASMKVLGLSYNALGIGVAKSWNFPSRLVAGMAKYSEGEIKTPHGDIEQLNVTVNLANELCAVSAITDVSQKSSELQKLCNRFEKATHLSSAKLAKTLEAGLNVLSQRSAILGVPTGKSPLLKKIRKWSGHAEPDNSDATPGDGVPRIDTLVPEEATQPKATQDPDAMLSAGIQDVTNALVDDTKLNDVLLMVVETIFRSLNFKHTLIFIRDNKQNAMVAKMGFGDGVDAILPRLKFPIAFVPDVFHLSIDKGADIVIEDVDALTIADKIPKWYRDSMDTKCFLMLPIMIKSKAIGLIYADVKEANSLKLSEKQLSMLRTLRNQAVLAIKQNLP